MQIENNKLPPCLYIVPTPIGNLQDITFRAMEILKTCDIIAAEDTRHSGLLLKALNIPNENRLESYFDFNEEKKAITLIEKILAGKSVALISDAGTPCISDPGYRLVNEAQKYNVKIVALPGATAFVPALVASGFSNHCFTFVGFPPAKKGRKTFIQNAVQNKNTTILYESSHKIVKLIKEIANLDNNRNVFISREISKIYEEHLHFNTKDFLEGKVAIKEKGEFVVVVESGQGDK